MIPEHRVQKLNVGRATPVRSQGGDAARDDACPEHQVPVRHHFTFFVPRRSDDILRAPSCYVNAFIGGRQCRFPAGG
jgi:hypothetical protein